MASHIIMKFKIVIVVYRLIVIVLIYHTALFHILSISHMILFEAQCQVTVNIFFLNGILLNVDLIYTLWSSQLQCQLIKHFWET